MYRHILYNRMYIIYFYLECREKERVREEMIQISLSDFRIITAQELIIVIITISKNEAKWIQL